MPNTIYGGCGCPQCRNQRKRPLPLTEEELLELQRQQRVRKLRERKAAELAELERRKPAPIPPPPDNQQCTVTKSIDVPNGHACYPPGRAHFEGLDNYGTYAVLSTSGAITEQGTSLQLIDGSVDGRALAKQLGGGALALSRVVTTATTGGAVAGGTVLSAAVAGTVAMLLPNNSLASDAAFYSREDFADLTVANTGVRINIKYLPEQSVTAFGIYTGNHPHWRSVPMIAAAEQGEQLVADLGDGIGPRQPAPAINRPFLPLKGRRNCRAFTSGPKLNRPNGSTNIPSLRKTFATSSSGFPPDRKCRRSTFPSACATRRA